MARSAKAQREELRKRLLDADRSVSQIAAEMAHRFNARPRLAWRYALGWPQWKVVQEFRAVNPGLPIGDNRISEWESWPHGGSQPGLKSLAGLAAAFGNGCTASDLVDAVDLANFPATERHYFESARAGEVTSGSRQSPAGHGVENDAGPAADLAAQESWWHLATAATAIDPTGVETVHDAVVRLARRYDTLPPSHVLAEARRTRDLAYTLLDQTRRPAQQMDLNLAAGMSCALLAGASFDLGQPEAAIAQARAAAKYAELIGHTGLMAWSTGYLSLLAYWSGSPRDAVQIADVALAASPGGSASARLQAIRARAWALIGDNVEVTDSVQRADDLLAASNSTDELHDEVGGEFAWGPARNSMCAGTALVTVGDPTAGAERLRETIAAAPGTVSRQVLGRSRIDLATAELAAGRFDAAADQLHHVWPTPVDQRRIGLTGRLDRLHSALEDQRWKTHRPARALRDQITAFTGEATNHRALLLAGGGLSGEVGP